jgi:site-specific DNA recombinase
VTLHVLYALTHERNYELLAPAAPDIDAPALRAERAAIKETLKRYAREEVLNKRTPEQVTEATLVGTQRIGEIDQILNANVTDDPLAEIINAADPVQAWQDTPIGSKRILLDRLMTVTILPIGRGGRGFDRSSVRIDPKHRLGAPSAAATG